MFAHATVVGWLRVTRVRDQIRRTSPKTRHPQTGLAPTGRRLTMTRRQCVTFAAIIALCLGIYTSSFALPANPITACPFAITAGGTYTLTADLTASGDCITIAQPLGESVTVALNGFSITGDGSGAAIVAD